MLSGARKGQCLSRGKAKSPSVDREVEVTFAVAAESCFESHGFNGTALVGCGGDGDGDAGYYLGSFIGPLATILVEPPVISTVSATSLKRVFPATLRACTATL